MEPRALEAMIEALRETPANASSVHRFGQTAKQKLEAARRSVAQRMGASAREVIFTSGGTEADNLALFGVVRASSKSKKHVITTAIEHPAVLQCCARMVREGVAVTFVPVGSSGVVDPDDVKQALRSETVLISVMHANNETGAIQPVREIAAIAEAAGIPMHSDGVQMAGRMAIDVRHLGVNLYSLSAHKMNGPKGAGALYLREKTKLHAVQCGGHQEREHRAGTENVPAIVGFGTVAESLPERWATPELRDRFEQQVLARVPGAVVNAGSSPRLANTSNIRFPGVSGEAMVIALDLAGFAVSTGAACASGSIEPSHVLLAMGLRQAEARASLRFSFGLGNTLEQIDRLVDAVIETFEHLVSGNNRVARLVAHHA